MSAAASLPGGSVYFQVKVNLIAAVGIPAIKGYVQRNALKGTIAVRVLAFSLTGLRLPSAPVCLFFRHLTLFFPSEVPDVYIEVNWDNFKHFRTDLERQSTFPTFLLAFADQSSSDTLSPYFSCCHQRCESSLEEN